MKVRSTRAKVNPFRLGGIGHLAVSMPRMNRRSPLWTMIGGIMGSILLFWIMVQLGQASSGPKSKTLPQPQSSVKHSPPQPVQEGEIPEGESADDAKLLAPPVTHGPAIDLPREVVEMLEQRKRDLDRREETIRENEERLMIVRSQIEQLLDQNEALEKRIQSAQGKGDHSPAQLAKIRAEKDRAGQEQRMQLAKIYEAMASEDAAARLERMPDRKAIEILRMVKSKTAGAILAQVKADRAAKLTEQLLAHTP